MKEITYEEPNSGDIEDDGTMPENVAELAGHVVGHRIVKAERREVAVPWWVGSTTHFDRKTVLALTLDDGRQVHLADTDDCCAYTELENVIEHLPTVDHIITAVNTTDGYTRWHILADAGEVLELQVGWSAGNPFYYGYGFDIAVIDAPPEDQS